MKVNMPACQGFLTKTLFMLCVHYKKAQGQTIPKYAHETFMRARMLSEKHRAARLNSLFLTIPIGIMTVITITETLTPWLLRLPFHHCPFCLFFLHPLSLVFIVLFWFGLATPWLTLVTHNLGRSNDESKESENNLRKKLTSYAVFAMIIALTILLVDVLIVFS